MKRREIKGLYVSELYRRVYRFEGTTEDATSGKKERQSL